MKFIAGRKRVNETQWACYSADTLLNIDWIADLLTLSIKVNKAVIDTSRNILKTAIIIRSFTQCPFSKIRLSDNFRQSSLIQKSSSSTACDSSFPDCLLVHVTPGSLGLSGGRLENMLVSLSGQSIKWTG